MKGFNQKLFSGIVAIVLVFLPVLGDAVFSLWKVVSGQHELIAIYTEELLLSRDLRRLLNQQNALVPVFVLSGEMKRIEEFTEVNKEFDLTLTRLEELATAPEDKKLLSEIRQYHDTLFTLATPGVQMKNHGLSTKKVNEYFHKSTGPYTKLLIADLNQYVVRSTKAYEEEKTDNVRVSNGVFRALGIVAVIAILLAAIIGALLLKLIRQKQAFDHNNETLARKEKELSEARKEAIEVVAHDLKNPLASIIMSTQFALADGFTDSQQIKMNLEINLRSAESMKRLIDDLLDHTKIESGSLVLNKKPCNLSHLLKTLTERFQPMVAKKELILRCEVPSYLPLISLDEGRIEQVISNFVGNAIKFTPPRGAIVISVSLRDLQVIIAVTDTGLGMTEEQKSHVFDRYWQVRETAKQGTGLGLAIAKAIVHAHDGKISVESEPGRGSSFIISIPAPVKRLKPIQDEHHI